MKTPLVLLTDEDASSMVNRWESAHPICEPGLLLDVFKLKFFILALLFGASKGLMKVFKAVLKPFEVPERSVKIKISVDFLSSSGIETGKVK